jgi:hypothetical protein
MKDEALRLALEALKKCASALAEELAAWDIDPPLHHVLEASNACGPAIDAIEQALANEALDKMAENERELGIQMQPEPEDYPTYDGYIKKALEQLNPSCKTGSQCTSKCEGCAEPEPKTYHPPKMWRDDEIARGYRGIRWVTDRGVYGRPSQEEVEKYLGYTLPKREPLTDEQKLALCKQFPDHLTFNAIKAIEAAHGIKENT